MVLLLILVWVYLPVDVAVYKYPWNVGSSWIREQEIVVFHTELSQVLEVGEELAWNLVLVPVDTVVE